MSESDKKIMTECRKLITEKMGDMPIHELEPFVKGAEFGMELAKRVHTKVISKNVVKIIKGEA